MRRLGKYLGIFTLTLIFSVVLTLCSLESLSHTSVESKTITAQSCVGSCLTHAQTAVSSSTKSQDNENSKQTTLVGYNLPEIPISLSAPFLMIAASFFFVCRSKLTLLTLPLRL